MTCYSFVVCCVSCHTEPTVWLTQYIICSCTDNKLQHKRHTSLLLVILHTTQSRNVVWTTVNCSRPRSAWVHELSNISSDGPGTRDSLQIFFLFKYNISAQEATLSPMSICRLVSQQNYTKTTWFPSNVDEGRLWAWNRSRWGSA